MKHYLMHPATTGKTRGVRPGLIIISEVYYNRVKRKETLLLAFSIDMPPYYGEGVWNLHADGCNYPYTNLDDCLWHGARIFDWDGEKHPGWEITATDKPFEQYGIIYE